MIRNKLTKIEFHKILSSIFNLNGYDKIRTSLFELLYYKPLSPVGDHTPTINLKSTGVKTTYRGFDIEITSLVEFGIVIKLTKKQTMLDGFFNSPSYSLSNEIIRYFEKEYYRDCFTSYRMDNYGLVSGKEYHLKSTLNSDWYKKKNLSPIMIIAEERIGKYLVQFQFNLQCFQTSNYGITLKDNWEELCWKFDSKFA